jgi:hypothetical protein
MERELFEHIVMSVCKSEEKTKQVMDIVYGITKHQDKEIGSFKRCQNKHFYRKELNKCPFCKPIIESVPVLKEVSKKQELIDSLDYLKKKEHKTEKDKESISIIQAILNGMK